MITEYIAKKLAKAKYKVLKDGTYFGEIPGLRGVWASAPTLERCREELKEVLEDWLILKIRGGERIADFRVKHDRRELVRA
ncbi:MAG: type II toxin-antitoxin system HicB family antitoxin [Patescibacteria group bacterium]